MSMDMGEVVSWDAPAHGGIPFDRCYYTFSVPSVFLCSVMFSEIDVIDLYVTLPMDGCTWLPKIFLHWGGTQMGNVYYPKNTAASNYGRVAVDHAIAEINTRWWSILNS